MLKSDPPTGKDVELCFKRNFNIRKYRELTNFPEYLRLFNPRGFTILLWESQ